MPPSSSSTSALPFRRLVHSYIQTRVSLPPHHLSPSFAFVGSIPASELPSRDTYLAYRNKVLSTFPDWLNSAQEVVFSETIRPRDGLRVEHAIAKLVWTGTHSGPGDLLDRPPTGRRVCYRGLVWLERVQGDEGLTRGEVYGDLAKFHRQLAGEAVSDEEWFEARTNPIELDVD